MSAPFLPMTTPGRAEWMVIRLFLAARSMTMRRRRPGDSRRVRNLRSLRSSCSRLPYSLRANQREVPGAVDAEPQADRIDFLTHQAVSSFLLGALAHHDRQMREMLLDPRRAAAAAGMEALQHKGAADRGFRDVKPVDIELVVVLGVGDRRLQHLLDLVRDAAAREGQFVQRRGGRLAADRSAATRLSLRALMRMRAQEGRGFVVVEPALGGWLAHLRPSFAFLSPAWP